MLLLRLSHLALDNDNSFSAPVASEILEYALHHLRLRLSGNRHFNTMLRNVISLKLGLCPMSRTAVLGSPY